MARAPLPNYILPPDSVKIFEEIGKGGFSRVFAAAFTDSFGQVCKAAAKKVRASILVDEVTTLQQLDHKNIIKFHGVFKGVQDDTFIIMELAERKDLRHLLNNYRVGNASPIRLPFELMKKWTLEAAWALQYLHSLHYIHRDIKSLNFLVMMNFSLKLADLGLSKELLNTAKTKGGGTCQWMAPEVISKQCRSRKSDVFSYGIVVWEIFTTDVPHKNIKGDYKIMQAVCHEEKRPDIPEDCPPKLARIIQACWMHDYNQRPTMDDICAEYQTCPVDPNYIPDETLFQGKQTMGPPPPLTAAAAVQDSVMEMGSTAWSSSQDVDMLSQPSSEETICASSPQDRDLPDSLHQSGHPTVQPASLQTLQQQHSIIQSQQTQSAEGQHTSQHLTSHSSLNLYRGQSPASLSAPIQDTAGVGSFSGPCHQEAANVYGFSPLDSRDQQPRNIPARSLEDILTDVFLLNLVKELGSEWKQLGIYLGYKMNIMDRFRQENPTITDSCLKMMVNWRHKQDRTQGTRCIIDKLCDALAQCDRKDLESIVRQNGY